MPTTQQTGREDGRAAGLALWNGLLEACRRVSRRLDTELWERYSLTAKQYAILSRLAAAPQHQMSITALAGKLDRPVSEVSRISKQGLEDRLLIERRQAGQQAFLRLTQTGITLIRRAEETHFACIERHLLSKLTSRDATAIQAALTRVNLALALPGP
jgi:DNA-binding MarR family transcriptional regulator